MVRRAPSRRRPSSAAIATLAIGAAVAGVLLGGSACRRPSEPARLVAPERVLKLLGPPQQLVPEPSVGERVRLQRVHVELSQERIGEVIAADPLRTRQPDHPGTLLVDARDGWIAGHGTQFAVDLPPEVTGTLRVDAAVAYSSELADRGALPEGLVLNVAVGLADGAGEPRLLVNGTLPAVGETQGWTPLEAPLATLGLERPRLVFMSLLGGVAPEALTPEVYQNVLAGWANPMLVRGAAAPETPRDPPNVIVLTIDTLRADHLGCYGYERDTSPNLDALVARGTLFEDAVSAAPWTLPSYGSLFTGRYPTAHRAGVREALDELWGTAASGEALDVAVLPAAKNTEPLCDELVTLAEALRDQGYRTAGLFNNPFLSASRGVDQGFERYAYYRHTARTGVDEALRWIDEQEGAPFFLFLHLMDPHMPYAPPPPYDARYTGVPLAELEDVPLNLHDVRARPDPRASRQLLVDLYDGEIAYTDAEVGRFDEGLRARGLAEETLIVLHSDHGEEFWEHGGFEHGHALYREVLRVPLAFVYPPRVPAGRRVAARVRTIDVLPTVLELLGLGPEAAELDRGRLSGDAATLNARSLVPWIDGEREDPLDSLSESLLYGPPDGRWWEQKARSEGGLKLIAGGPAATDELYDVALDPGETRDLAAERRADAEALRRRLGEAYLGLRGTACTGGTSAPSRAEVDLLRALGYVDGEEDEGDDEGDG